VLLAGRAPYNGRMTRCWWVVAAALAAGCSPSDPDADIRAALSGAETAAEARDAGYFADLIDPDYRDARGNDRTEILRRIRGYFLVNQHVEIVSRIDEVRLEGADAAHAVVQAGMLGQRSGAALLGGVSGDLYRFEIELVNRDGDWRVIGASWDRALGE
jgi:alkanesulfonate monooxygenase SsuD/methylene tetrahydromethanopterin reductase-like flavin-dependent oxidoreductase (luciferase family)